MNAPTESPFKPRSKSRARRREAPPYRRKILFEALEPRLLLSADGGANAIADLGYTGFVSHEWRPGPGRDFQKSLEQCFKIMDV